MKVLIGLLIAVLIDIVLFTLVIPFVVKKLMQRYGHNKAMEAEVVDVNPVVGLIGGVR